MAYKDPNDPRIREVRKRTRAKMKLLHPEATAEYSRRYRQKNLEARRQADRERNKRRRDALDALKSIRGCETCRECNPACLDFHHRDPKQKVWNVSNAGRSWNWDRVLEEAAKCDVLCANCHRKEERRRSTND